MGRRPITPPKGTFYKKSPLESRKTAFGLYCPVFHRLPPGYQKSPYIPPTRLRRRGALVQRIARSTRKIRPSDTSSHQAVYGAPPHNPAKGDFLQKVPFGIPKNSVWPLLSGFFIVCPQGIKNHRTYRLPVFGAAVRLFSASRDQPTKPVFSCK